MTGCLKGDGLAFITPKKYAALKKPHFLDTSRENIQRGVKFVRKVRKGTVCGGKCFLEINNTQVQHNLKEGLIFFKMLIHFPIVRC